MIDLFLAEDRNPYTSVVLDKATLLVGGAGPIGSAVAQKVEAFGHRVLLMDLHPKGHQQASDSARRVLIQGDVRMPSPFHKVLEQLDAQQLQLAGVVYLAMINPDMSLGQSSDRNADPEVARMENIQAELDVGLGGALRTFDVLGERMMRDKTSVVIVSSDLGLIAPDHRVYEGIGPGIYKSPGYTVTKHGLIGLARHMGTTMAMQGVRVNAVAPGPVGPLNSGSLQEALEYRIPMGRLASPSEVASGIWFLLSKDSSFMNASVLTIDGGRTAW